MKHIRRLFVVALALGLSIWLLDLLLSALLQEDLTISFLFDETGPERLGRAIDLLGFILFSSLLAHIWLRAQESEERNRHLVEHAADGILVSDLEGALIDTNRKACLLLGYSRDALLEKHLTDIIPPAELVILPLHLARLQEGGSIVFERTLLRRDGTGLPVEIHARMLPDGRIEGIFRDITERRQAEEARQRAARAYRVLAACNRAMVRATDETGLMRETCQIVVENGAYRLAWVGLVEKGPERLIRPVAHAGEDHGYLEAIRVTWADEPAGYGPTGTAIRTRRTVVNRNVEEDPFFHPWREAARARGFAASVALPLLVDDRILGALNLYTGAANAFDHDEVKLLEELARDLAFGLSALRTRHEHRRAEAELRRLYGALEQRVEERTAALAQANLRLQKLSQVKDEFVRNMSHELRTPLTSLKLNHSLLSLRNESVPSYLARMEREIERLEQLIERVLTLSRLDQGRITLNPVPVQLDLMVGQLVDDRRPLAQEKEIALGFSPGLPGVIGEYDPRLLQEAVGALLTNAINFTPAGGTIRVSTHRTQQANGTRLGIRIADSGPGIPPDERPHLFERFFRGSAARDASISGTGLGLAIAAEIVSRHDGEILLAEEDCRLKGACFHIWLPTSAAK